MLAIGVRSSWLIVDTTSSFIRSASSSRATDSSSRCSASACAASVRSRTDTSSPAHR
jgi:hypothetical protein